MFIHPILYKYTYPRSADVILKAVMMSNIQDPEQRDVRYLMSILSRLERAIPRLKSHISSRRSLISSAAWKITATDEAFTDQAEEANRRLKKFINKYFKIFIDADMYGLSVARINWRQSQLGLIPDLGKAVHPTEIETEADAPGGIVFLNPADALSMKFYREEIAVEDQLSYITRVTDSAEPGGVLVTLIFHAFLLNMSTQEWFTFIQKMKGIIHGTHDGAASTEEIEAGIKGLETAVEDNYVFSSDKIKFLFNKIADSNASVSFDTFQNALKEDCEVVITGATSLANDRERSAATVQERSQETIAADGRLAFAEIINDQLLRYDYYLNVKRDSIDVEPPYQFEFIPKLSADREKNARIIAEMVGVGYPVSHKEVEAKTGIKTADPEDEQLKPPAYSSF